MYDFSFPEIKIPEMTELADMPAQFMWSDTQFEIIKKHITDFENKLDQNHEVGLMLTNFGQTVTMQVTEIGYEKSVLMVYKGYVNGNKAILIQHINQINFLLTAIPRPEPEKPKVQIGFVVNK